ncbi:MAG: tryptophan synthase subunit alpha [Actinobacteria bacterium]|nr:tryptophan synthase subunit alpha [Actinomycetota bacterium]
MNAGHERLGAAFSGSGKRAALMPYMMAGFPSFDQALEIGRGCARAGADVLELGIPFSDPLADGPVIHAAGTRALAAGATVDRALGLAAALAGEIPVVVMCYANQILARGYERFAGLLAGAAVSGLIVPDVPLEEAPELGAACEGAGVALVPLVAPTTTDERLAAIGALARGFVYTVSLMGTTGERAALSDTFALLVARARRFTSVPVAVGFGIGTPEQARQAAEAGADGVIIGSRLVRAAGESADPAAAVSALVGAYAEALAVPTSG